VALDHRSNTNYKAYDTRNTQLDNQKYIGYVRECQGSKTDNNNKLG